jgi:hypothetical protein
MTSLRIDNRVPTLPVRKGLDRYNFPWFAIIRDKAAHSKGRDNFMRFKMGEDGIAGTQLGPNRNGRKC